MSEDESRKPRIIVEREQLAGVWANSYALNFSKHEFTLDFIRLDPVAPRGIVVARVSCSSSFVADLVDDLGTLWQDWARKAMPPEVKGEDGPEPA